MAQENTTWLDACFIQKILQNSEKDESIVVSDITVQTATAKGDNYGSDMRRVTVALTRVQDGHTIQEKKSLIVKIVPEGEAPEKMMEETGFFRTELSMMSVTLPQMNKLLENECSILLGPRCLNVQYEKPTHVVMEDLVPRGFRMVERHAGLDLDHCLLAVRNLGRFHASSVALKEKDPKALTSYVRALFHEDNPPLLHAFSTAAMKVTANETRNWNELSPRISEKLLKLSESVFDKACKAIMYREDEFNVLNHGDFWINNMLFRYDEQQRPIDHIFVDFQICYHGSPAMDLLYFLATSPSDDVRFNHRGKLLHEYHNSLISTMIKLKCKTKALSFDDLKKILKKRAVFEAILCCILLPLVLLNKSKADSLDEVLAKLEGGYDNPGCREPAYRKIMTRLLPLYDNMGLFDD